jgi:hypothetical protein
MFIISIQKADDVGKPWDNPEIASPFHPCSIRNKLYEIADSGGTTGLDIVVAVQLIEDLRVVLQPGPSGL